MRGNRVAFFVQDLEGGGVQRAVVNLSAGLLKLGVDVDVILVRRKGPFLDLVPPGVRLIDLRSRRTMFAVPALVRYLKRERPATLVSNEPNVNIVAVLASRLARTRTRLVLTEQIHISSHRVHERLPLLRLAYRLMPWVYPLADEIVGVSKGVSLDLANVCRIPERRVRTIHNPVVTEDLLSKASEHVEHPWFAPGAPPVVIGVGRLTLQKDFDTLIRAFDLARRRCNARLMILGEGELRPTLEERVRSLGLEDQVALPGYVGNPYPYMRRSNVFVLSSLWEGFGNVLVEAMACGTSVISTDCPSGPAEILADGCYGRLVPSADPAAMAAAIIDTLEHPTDPDLLKTRASDFTTDRIAGHYLKWVDRGSENEASA